MSNDSFFKVRVKTLTPEKPTTFDLYVRINQQNILYLKAGDCLSLEKIQSLNTKDSGQHFMVKEEDRKAYKTYVHEQMISPDLAVREKAIVLRESSMTLIEELYEDPDVSKALEASRPVIEDFVQFMQAEPEAMSHLISLSGHDFYTYNHSLDVSIYSLGLGEALQYSKAELEELGMAALLHDIGKKHVHLDILCKKGSLSDVEWQQMQKHPQYGLTILSQFPNISDAIKAACYEHHESWSGNGYPQQLSRDEIHPFARIVAIADTYDAMTTQRSYNVPMKPFEAVTMMKEKLAGRYDPDMLKAMHSVLFKLKTAG